MKYLLLCCTFLLFGTLCFAQNVSDVVATQVGNNVVVSYTIDKEASTVKLTVSTDGGKTFSSPLKKVSGDIKYVQAGRRSIVWDVLSERDKLVGDNIVFEVIIRQKDDVLIYEETFFEMDTAYENKRLREIKKELEEYDKMLKDTTNTAHFGLS